MQILITGGTGFIGRALCRSLLRQGHGLTVLSRQPAQRVRRLCGEAVTPISGFDALSRQSPCDAVVNLAGEPIAAARWSDARKKLLWDSRVRLTGDLVDFMADLDKPPSVLISGSAVGYYGDRGDTVLDEGSDAADDFSHRLCDAWEEAARRACDLGVRVCLLRTGLVVGRGGGFLQRMLPLFRLGLGGRIGSGRQWMSWIHLDDYIALTGHLLAGTHSSGVFNGTAPHPVTNLEFTATLARLLHRPAPLPVPAFLLGLTFGEMAQLLLGGQRVVPARPLAEGFQFRHERLESALRAVLEP